MGGIRRMESQLCSFPLRLSTWNWVVGWMSLAMWLPRKSGPAPFRRQGERSAGSAQRKAERRRRTVWVRMGRVRYVVGWESLRAQKGGVNPPLKGLWLRGWVIQDFGQGVDARRVGRIFCCGGTFFEGWRHMLQLCQFVFVHVGRFGALDRFA